MACSLDFCLQEQFEEFNGCESTITFIRIFNKLFDILNSRNLKSCGWKAPIQEQNYENVFKFLIEAKKYILSLKETANGKLLVNGNRHVGFYGFVLCITSVMSLFQQYVLTNEFGLKFLLTYKFSQDHIELFFGQIRSHGGCNNNPTAMQFASAYKRLLSHNEIQDVTRGNCLPLESIPILTASSRLNDFKKDSQSVQMINTSTSRYRANDDIDMGSVQNDHDYVYAPTHKQLTEVAVKIVVYISGFVVHKLRQSISCEVCVEALLEQGNPSSLHKLINIKNRGGLSVPSWDVIQICVSSESVFRKYVATDRLNNVSLARLVALVLESFLEKSVFACLSSHMLDSEGYFNHVVLLIKAVAETYFRVRYFYAGKQYTAKLKEKLRCNSRQVLNKLIIFSGQ